MVKKIMPFIEAIPHKRYVEPFGGGASIMLAKEPVEVETYNDLDSGLYDFFTTIAHPDTFEEFRKRIALYPFGREIYNDSLKTYRDETDKMERVLKWFVVVRQSFGGRFGSGWGMNVTGTARNMAKDNSSWISAIELLPEVHARLQRVQIENKDAIALIKQHDTKETLFYCDPPYVLSTRKGGGYDHELSDEYHEQLLDTLINVKGSVVLSGYNHPIYSVLDNHGFSRTDFETVSHVAGRTQASNLQGKGSATKHAKRVESVWVRQAQ